MDKHCQACQYSGIYCSECWSDLTREIDTRSEQKREAIDHARRIWDTGKRNLDALHIRFNAAIVESNNPREGKSNG